MADVFSMFGAFTLKAEHGAEPLGVEAELPVAPALILFGPNDSGKTNVMRVLSHVLRGSPWIAPRDRFRNEPWPIECKWSVRLDLNEPSHRALLLQAAKRAVKPFDEHPLFGLETDSVLDDDGPALRVRGHGLKEIDYWSEGDPEREELLVESLKEALRELVAGSTGAADADEVVERVMRTLRLSTYWRGTSLELGDDVAAHSELDDENLERVRTSVGGWLISQGSLLPELVTLVESDDLASSIGDSQLAERVLAATTGWARDKPDPYRFPAYEWMRLDEASLDEEFQLRSDPWFDQESDGLAPQLIEGCARLSELATRLAPGFVTRNYRIELQVLEPRWWDLNGGRRLRVALVPHDAQPEWDDSPLGFGLDSVGAGLRIWALFAVYEAIRRSSDRTNRATLFLFDEPERHLHPVAQREAAAFIASIVAEGANVIVATHAPAFLNAAIPQARYVRLSRSDGVTCASPLDPGRLATLEENWAELGLSRADLIQLTRGALLVEGEHDRCVVESFFADDLAAAQIRILSLRGTDNALALLDAELLQQLDVPVFLMFDGTSSRFIEELHRGRITPGGTKEEKALKGLALALRSRQFVVTPVPFDVPDIVWALPERAVKMLEPSFPGWEQATAALRQHKGSINPRGLLRERYGLNITLSFLDRALAVAHEHELEPSPELKGAMAAMLDAVGRV